ncbi:hypothetical protein RSAG8_11265, partial [Rhizoctonia solani AG-8 WAC10335]
MHALITQRKPFLQTYSAFILDVLGPVLLGLGSRIH